MLSAVRTLLLGATKRQKRCDETGKGEVASGGRMLGVYRQVPDTKHPYDCDDLKTYKNVMATL